MLARRSGNVTLQNRLLALSPDGRALVMWQTRFPLGDAPLALG